MAFNSKQKSSSSGSREPRRAAQRSAYSNAAMTQRYRSQRASASRMSANLGDISTTSRTVGEIRREERQERARQQRKSRRGAVIGAIIGLILLCAAAGGAAYLYFSDVFLITEIRVEGVEHLTSAEMQELINVQSDATLLRVDTATIEARCKKDAWVESVEVKREFPHTLVVSVTERTVAAIVDVPIANTTSVKKWAISSDRIWLMPIPEKDSEAASAISQKIFEDIENALEITDVPYTTTAEIGATCTDSNVNNALAIVSGMTTELASQVKSVSATDAQSTTLCLENGIEIAFGAAEDIRSKERVCLKIMEEYEGRVAFINVRDVQNPTWRYM